MALNSVTEMQALFEAEGVEYALCGGLALAVHGHPRMTEDIDLLVRPETVARTIEVARRTGFDVPAHKMTFGLLQGRAREIQRVSKLAPSTGELSLDLIIVNDELEDVWATRIRVRSDTHEMTVVSRQGLATMKRLAGHPQDLADLAKLEGHDEEPAD